MYLGARRNPLVQNRNPVFIYQCIFCSATDIVSDDSYNASKQSGKHGGMFPVGEARLNVRTWYVHLMPTSLILFTA